MVTWPGHEPITCTSAKEDVRSSFSYYHSVYVRDGVKKMWKEIEVSEVL